MRAAAADRRDVAARLFDDAFAVSRTPRSDAYKAGVLAALRYRLNGVRIESPYQPGTAEFDAFHAGTAEGHRLAAGHDASLGAS